MKLLGAKSGMKCVLMALIGAGAVSVAYGDSIVVTYAPAKTQTPVASTLCTGASACWLADEKFSSSTAPTTAVFTPVVNTGVATGSITGVYSGALSVSNDHQWGGAGGTGYYATVTNNHYTLALSTSGSVPGVNYFGLWFSALDNGNELQFYKGNTLIYTFTPALFSSLVGACPNASNAFCGNPNNGQDSAQQFAYLNFFDTTGYFDKIVFTETLSNAGFESDNHTVGYMNPIDPTGTVIGATPEPGSIVLLLTGLLALIGFKSRFAFKH
jgi:hypothetical protein